MSVSVQKRQEWFTTAEIAAQNLPTMPSSRQGCERLAIDSEWRERANLAGSPLARRRKGYGGGWEYHYTVLPPRAVAALAARGIVTDDIGSGPKDRDQRWAFFDALPETAKAEARRRADAIAQVEAIMRAGTTKQAAVAEVCGKQGVSPATIYNWFKMVEGLKKAERLPALAPKYRGRSKRTPLPEEAFDALKADYLRLSQPSSESCYDRLKRIADEKGWTLPCSRTLRRRLEAEVPPEVIVLKRAGREALDALYPTQKRDRSHFHALEAVNADGHIWDVWVKWPGEAKPIRPVMVEIQDLHSNKNVGWRVGFSENKEQVREYLTKACRILAGLQGSLDYERGGDIAVNLGELYGYSIRKLFAANVNVDNAPDNVAEVKSLLEPIAEAWENMDLSKPRQLMAV